MLSKTTAISLATLSAAVLALLATAGFVRGRAVSGQPEPGPPPQEAMAFRRPVEIDDRRGPADEDRVWALGRKIFFDPRLSASSTISCATCHQPGQSWSDHLPKAVGEAHKPLAFRAPTLLNAGHIDRYGWTGRFPDVGTTAFFAMTSAGNMNAPLPRLIAKLEADSGYAAAFRDTFPKQGITKQTVSVALDRFVTSIVSDAAPFDRWLAGDGTAVDASVARGFAVFTGKAKCAECHSGWTFTDGSFHDIGTASGADIGRGAIFKTSIKLQYAFKTPTLRDVATRSPYMHNGSIVTLEAVVDHYNKGGIDRPSRDPDIRPLGLSRREKDDLVAFLKSLTGGSKFVVKSGS